MIIDYNLKKQHGRYRPILTINISLEQWESDLNPQKVSVNLLCCIQNWHPLTTDEAEKNVSGNCEIKIDAFSWSTNTRKNYHEYTITMPYREGKNPAYPEIDQALNELREKWEAAVLEAYNSIAFEINKEIGPSEPYKKKIAPWVAKQKMMKSAEVLNE